MMRHTDTTDSKMAPSTSQKTNIAMLNGERSTPRSRIGMVVDMPETNVFAELLFAVSGMNNERCTYEYCRPDFLHFSPDEIQLSADKTIRPVLCPKFALPVYAGYAEVINCGKSEHNEDMASALLLTVTQQGYTAEKAVDLSESLRNSLKEPFDGHQLPTFSKLTRLTLRKGKTVERRTSDDDILQISRSFSSDDGFAWPSAELAYFAIFDGHAGSATAIMASKCLHQHVKAKLDEVLESILHLYHEESLDSNLKGEISADGLVIGALESAFIEMDAQIGAEKSANKMPGGCATIVALFFLNKIYVANAGDCRAVLISATKCHQLSTDFNPASERKRLQSIAYRNREIIANSFSRLEYSRHLLQKDLNTKVLYRDWFMDGWAAKTVRQSDLKPTLIANGRKSRLLNTIGVSRGLGDHNLVTVDDKIPIKPFLSAVPEVQIFDTRSMDSLSERDVLVMASDGFWDVFSNEEVFEMVNESLASHAPATTSFSNLTLENDEATKYTLLAQELAAAARGNPTDNCRWKLTSGAAASLDDITVFVIPLKFALNATIVTDDDDEELLAS